MLQKEKVKKLIAEDPYFVDLYNINWTIRRSRYKIRQALSVLREFKCSEEELKKTLDEQDRMDILFSNFMEDAYGITWHNYELIDKELDKPAISSL